MCSHLQVHRGLQGLQVDLGTIVRPGPELHLAALMVEGEEGDVDGAGGLVDGRGHPADLAGVEQLGLGHVGDGELSVSAERRARRGVDESTELALNSTGEFMNLLPSSIYICSTK